MSYSPYDDEIMKRNQKEDEFDFDYTNDFFTRVSIYIKLSLSLSIISIIAEVLLAIILSSVYHNSLFLLILIGLVPSILVVSFIWKIASSAEGAVEEHECLKLLIEDMDSRIKKLEDKNK